jgi:hypothetical protein
MASGLVIASLLRGTRVFGVRRYGNARVSERWFALMSHETLL